MKGAINNILVIRPHAKNLIKQNLQVTSPRAQAIS